MQEVTGGRIAVEFQRTTAHYSFDLKMSRCIDTINYSSSSKKHFIEWTQVANNN